MMKSMNFLLLIPGFMLFSCSNDLAPNDLPDAVRNGFTQQFPAATTPEWEKEGNNFEAEFILENIEHEALFTPSGQLVMQKHDIAETALPEAVRTAVNQKFTGAIIDGAEQLQKDDKVYYQVELDVDKKEQLLVFSAEGTEQTEPAYWD